MNPWPAGATSILHKVGSSVIISSPSKTPRGQPHHRGCSQGACVVGRWHWPKLWRSLDGYIGISFPSVFVEDVSLTCLVLNALHETTLSTMYIFSLGILGALAAQVAAVPVPAGHVVHERRDYVPDTWAKHDRVDPTTTLPVRIGMTQQNLHKGYDLLLEV
jgi:hypothetical protein